MVPHPQSHRRPAARNGNGNSIGDAAPGNVKYLFRHLIQGLSDVSAYGTT
jgi:hypothetical protein